ncbi:hypothetical protein BJF80_13800 [Serinicoccus sp. CUA-874]|nr:hypothetical protein BJF80_13800 [Serinicoccus sp. CUA-874]
MDRDVTEQLPAAWDNLDAAPRRHRDDTDRQGISHEGQADVGGADGAGAGGCGTAASKAPAFKPASALKDAVNG